MSRGFPIKHALVDASHICSMLNSAPIRLDSRADTIRSRTRSQALWWTQTEETHQYPAWEAIRRRRGEASCIAKRAVNTTRSQTTYSAIWWTVLRYAECRMRHMKVDSRWNTSRGQVDLSLRSGGRKYSDELNRHTRKLQLPDLTGLTQGGSNILQITRSGELLKRVTLTGDYVMPS